MLIFLRHTLLLFILSTFCFNADLSAQSNDFSKAIAHSKTTNQRIEKDITTLSQYLSSPFKNEIDQLKALFYWTTSNIEYKISYINRGRTNTGPEHTVRQALKNRKGVCQDYSEVFNALCISAGFESLVILGYTKQNRRIEDVYSHAWNAVKINNEWYFFDPTWCSGHFDGNNYIRVFSADYFMIKPNEFIESHMPFDPLYQLFKNPITHKSFYKRIYIGNSKTFDFNKIIKDIKTTEEVIVLQDAIDRIEWAGIANKLIQEDINIKKKNLEILFNNIEIDKFNEAIQIHQNAITSFNQYIAARNNQFNAQNKQKDKILKLLSDTQSIINNTKKKNLIKTRNETLRLNLKIKRTELADLQLRIKEEEIFVKKRFSN